MHSAVVGIDIGGANLKAATWSDDQTARAASLNFPMWTEHARLAEATEELLRQLPVNRQLPWSLAVTMTGELADCFESRADGVTQILHCLERVVPAQRIHVYSVDGQWLTPQRATADPWSVAASNWHALASWLGRWPVTSEFCQQALVVDIGSTTVDIIPLRQGKVATAARTDRQRLELGQLIYTGLRRTPVCAVVQQLRLREVSIPVMAELFATVDDAWLVLGAVQEDPQDRATADGRPRTRHCAAARLARMIGEDRDQLSKGDLDNLATQVIDRQVLQIEAGIDRNRGGDFIKSCQDYLIYSGHGLPLWREVVRKMKSPPAQHILTDYIDEEVSRCAPAAAVAWLLTRSSGPSYRHLPA